MASGSDDDKGAAPPGGYGWRDPRMEEVARQLEDAAYAVVDIEEGSYSYYSRSVFTRAPVKALSVNLEDVVLPQEDHEEFMRLVHARFPFELGEARD